MSNASPRSSASETPASNTPGDSGLQDASIDEEGRQSLEHRESRREGRSKNTLIWRELALIGALCVVILAFNLNLGSPRGEREVGARDNEQIRLRDVRVTPPEPEPPEPEPEPQRRRPEPEVPKEMPREEVPDEQVLEEPEPTDEPVLDPVEELDTSPMENPEPAPAPAPAPEPEPDPPANKVFNQGTVDSNAQMRGNLETEYPRAARRAGIEGRVILQFVVDESGRPQDIQVLRSPNDMLSEAAIEALEGKSFEPAMQNGQPVKMRMSQPVTFRLQ